MSASATHANMHTHIIHAENSARIGTIQLQVKYIKVIVCDRCEEKYVYSANSNLIVKVVEVKGIPKISWTVLLALNCSFPALVSLGLGSEYSDYRCVPPCPAN